MKTITLALLSIISIPVIAAGGLTISTLPAELEASNPVCRDVLGKLSNCTPTAGVANKYLVPSVVDGNDIRVGALIGASTRNPALNVISETGYLVNLDHSGAVIHQFISMAYFESTDCSGTPYATLGTGRVLLLHQSGVYYSPRAIDSVQDKAVSSSGKWIWLGEAMGWNCTSHDPALNFSGLSPLLPNDSAVTGILDAYQAPLTIEMP